MRLIEIEGCTTLLVAEGIETTLAAWILGGKKYCAWAAISIPGLQSLAVPARYSRVVIAADNDPSAVGYWKGARVLGRRLKQEGRQVAICMPAAAGTDWNDTLIARKQRTQGAAA